MIESLKLKQLIKSFKNLKYSHTECTFNYKTHEQSVEDIIIQSGFILKHKDEKINGYCYLNQPNGSQNPPDFRVFDGESFIDIECKSKKTGYKPMWNSSIPNKDTFYIFSNQKDNCTLVIEGKDIITQKLEYELNQYKKETKLLENKYNKILKELSENDNPYQIGVYARNMFVQNKHFKLDQDQDQNQDQDNNLIMIE